MPSLATFNANNFFLRYKFARNIPGSHSQRSRVEAAEVANVGFLPGQSFTGPNKNYIVWDPTRRELAADALKAVDGDLPDILCLQEVENIFAIRKLNKAYLDGFYKYSLLIDSYDPRNIDVAVLSRYPIEHVASHMDEFSGGKRVFSRDCLEVNVGIPGQDITLFINHLKSKFVPRNAGESDAQYAAKVRRSDERRRNQARRVSRYIRERFQGKQNTALYAVVGDFNDTPNSPFVSPLTRSSFLTDVVSRHRGANDSWTYYWRARNRVSQIDYVLGSREFTRRVDRRIQNDGSLIPHIERAGLAYRELNADGEVLPASARVEESPNTRVDFRFPRYTEVLDDWRNNVSDHCPVKVWF